MSYNIDVVRNIYWEYTSMYIATYFNLKKENGISFTCLANYFERELERSPVFNTFNISSKVIVDLTKYEDQEKEKITLKRKFENE